MLVVNFICVIFIFINICYICRLRKKSDIIRLSVIYALCLLECIAVILHYGFVPKGHIFNNYVAVTQEGIKFTYYFFVIFILFKNSIKLAYYDKFPRKYIALSIIFVVNAAYILCILLTAFIKGPANTKKYCTDMVWILLRISHLASFLLLLVSPRVWGFTFHSLAAILLKLVL